MWKTCESRQRYRWSHGVTDEVDASLWPVGVRVVQVVLQIDTVGAPRRVVQPVHGLVGACSARVGARSKLVAAADVLVAAQSGLVGVKKVLVGAGRCIGQVV